MDAKDYAIIGLALLLSMLVLCQIFIPFKMDDIWQNMRDIIGYPWMF